MDKKPGQYDLIREAGIFLCFLAVRLAFTLFSGYNNYELQEDSSWYVGFADTWLRGGFNFDIGRFILSPGYVWFIAANKLLWGSYWAAGVVITQLLVSSLSGVYLYKLGKLIFDDAVALVAAGLFCILPLTFWWVHTFTAEILFQSLLVISLYYFILAGRTGKIRHLAGSAMIFGGIVLLKSHVILFTPFIAAYYFLNGENANVKYGFPVLYGAICVLCLLPFSLYCWNQHHTLVLSSNGGGYQFYLGNTEVGYITVVNPPERGTEDFKKLHNIVANAGYFNGDQAHYDSIMQLPQSIKQNLFTREAISWIRDNPGKWLAVKIQDTVSFLRPGISYKFYPFLTWLFVFLIYMPLYLYAYFGIMYAIKKEGWKKHLPVIGLFVTMFLFSTVWYVQNRFRTITIEPFYVLYASYVLVWLLRKTAWGKTYFTSS